MRLLLAAWILSACGRIGFDPLGGAGDGGGDDGTSGNDAPNVCTTLVGCPEDTMSVDNTSSVSDSNTVTADHGFAGGCGGAGTPETTWLVTPLSDGTYRIVGQSGGGSILYVRDECCTGQQLACGAFTTPIVITRKLGQKFVVFAEVNAVGDPAVQVKGIGL